MSAYYVPNVDIRPDLDSIQHIISSINNSYVISIDSNAHSEVWFDRRNDERGDHLLNFISQNNMILLNNNESEPTFDSDRGQSTIDLTLISFNLINSVTDWQISDESSLSDHKFITFNLCGKVEKIVFNSTLIYNTRKANWNSFNDEMRSIILLLTSDLKNIKNEIELNNFINNFMQILTDVCNKSIPKLNQNRRSKGNKWWTSELTETRRTVNQCRRRYQRCRTTRRAKLKTEYFNVRDRYKKLIVLTRLKSWSEFVTNTTRDNPWGLIYEIAKNKLMNRTINELKTSSGDILTDSSAIASTLFNTFFPIDSQIPETQIHQSLKQKLNEMKANTYFDKNDDNEFTIEEVTGVINAQNSRKAPGEDGLTADIIKQLNNIDQQYLCNVYNKCLKFATFQKIWKSSVVKAIPKAGKSDYRDPNAYRPISLLSVLAKIFEKLIINRIVFYLRKNSLINECQFGFTPQRSTEDALQSLISFVKKGLERKGYVLVVSLDISGAFNYAWWPKILYQLRSKRCPNNLFKLIENYFCDRSAKLWYLNEQIERKLDIGTPQGSSSGPWYWNLCYDDIFDLTEDNIQINGFADDTVVMIYSEDILELQNRANNKLRQIYDWGTNNKLMFNVSKTNCTLFTRKLKYTKPVIEFGGERLELVEHFKYLGLIIDSKLSWRSHAHYIKVKATQVLNNLLKFARNQYGLNEKAIEIIYKGAVLPLISYGCSVWVNGIDRKFIVEPLETLQRQVALRIIKGYRTVSTDAANVLANLIPINLYLRSVAAKYYIKCNISHPIVNSYFENTNLELDRIQRPVDIRTLPHTALRYSIKTTEHNNYLFELYFAGTSATGGAGGGGAYAIYRNSELVLKEKMKSANYCTLFQIELWTMNKAFEKILQFEGLESVTIIVKSRTVFQSVLNANSTNPIINKIYNNYYKAIEKGILIQIMRSTAYQTINTKQYDNCLKRLCTRITE
jgi:hypothetical protein